MRTSDSRCSVAYLGLVGQVDRQHRPVAADDPAPPKQPGVAARVAREIPLRLPMDILLCGWDTKPEHHQGGCPYFNHSRSY